MIDFLRMRVLPWFVWCLAMGTAGWLWMSVHRPSARGFVEAVHYSVTAPQTGRLATVTVQVGDRVRAGDVIATLDGSATKAELGVLDARREQIRAELDAVASRAQASVSEVHRDVEESVDAAERTLQEARSERSVRAAELAALNEQTDEVRTLVEKRMADRRDLVELEVAQTVLKKAIQQADAVVRQLQRQASSARARRDGVPQDAEARETEPLRAELAVLDLQQEVLRLRIDAMTLRAAGDGEVTALNLRAGEVVQAGVVVATITGVAGEFGAGAPIVRVCLDQEEAAKVQPGEAAILRGPDGQGPPRDAHVTQLGPQVAQLPARCWEDPRIPRWGRSVFLAVDDPEGVMPGQAFDVKFRGETSPHASAPPPRSPTSTVPSAGSSERPAATRPIVVPPALAQRSRVEPSGVTWVAALDRYVLVSDDTGWPAADEHAPWLLMMDAGGQLDEEPLVIEGLAQVRDLESIAPAADGGLYVMSSQAPSKRGKRHASRQVFAHVAIEHGAATLTRQVSFATLLDKDEALRASLGLTDTAGLEIEGMTAAPDGALLLGLKAPLDASGAALVWALPEPQTLLRTGDPRAAGLRVHGRIALEVMADGQAVPGGISELLALPDGSVLATATASAAADPGKQDGTLVHVASFSEASASRVLATFPGLKPEGLAWSSTSDSVVIVFDAGDDGTPHWSEQPWPVP